MFKPKTGIKSCEIFNACGTINDHPIVHFYKESQQVPGIKIESYILAPFPNTLAFSGDTMQKLLNKVKIDN